MREFQPQKTGTCVTQIEAAKRLDTFSGDSPTILLDLCLCTQLFHLFFFFLCVKNNWICFKQYMHLPGKHSKKVPLNNRRRSHKQLRERANCREGKDGSFLLGLLRSSVCVYHSLLWQTGDIPLRARGCSNTHNFFNSLFTQLHFEHTTVDMTGKKQPVKVHSFTRYCILIHRHSTAAKCLMACVFLSYYSMHHWEFTQETAARVLCETESQNWPI